MIKLIEATASIILTIVFWLKSKNNLIVCLHGRNRYCRHIIGASIFPGRWIRLFSMDKVLEVIGPQKKQLINQNFSILGENGILVWNDEIELALLKNNMPKFVFFDSIKRNLEIEDRGPRDDIKLIRIGVKKKRYSYFLKQKSIIYAGQILEYPKDDNWKKADGKAEELLLDFNLYIHLFNLNSSLYENFPKFNDKVLFRQMVINRFRLKLLRRLEDNFGDYCKFFITGGGEKELKNPRGTIDEWNLLETYKNSTCNLDLGSQSGTRWLYPRTAEILSVSSRLYQIPLAGSSEYFKDEYTSFLLLNSEDMLNKIGKMTSGKISRELMASFHDRINSINFQSSAFNRIQFNERKLA